MKQVMKVIIWVVILGAVFFGIYSVLPEYPQAVIKSIVQPIVDSNAKGRMEQIKNLKNTDLNETYQQILEGKTNTRCWVYQQGTGIETVTFFGKGATINIKDLKDHEDHLYTSTSVKFEFVITGNNVKINAYIEGELQDDEVKELMLRQLSGTSGY